MKKINIVLASGLIIFGILANVFYVLWKNERTNLILDGESYKAKITTSDETSTLTTIKGENNKIYEIKQTKRITHLTLNPASESQLWSVRRSFILKEEKIKTFLEEPSFIEILNGMGTNYPTIVFSNCVVWGPKI